MPKLPSDAVTTPREASSRAAEASVPDATTWVRIGAIIRPHGIRGELKLYLDNPDSELLDEGLLLALVPERGPTVYREVRAVFGEGDRVRLEGIDDRNEAERWRGVVIMARREDFPPLDDDESYLVDFVDAKVELVDGTFVGRIESFSDNGAQPLADVRCEDGNVVTMPFVPGIITHVDEEARLVVIDPPEGLFFGEAEMTEEEKPKRPPRRGKHAKKKAAPAGDAS